MAITAPEGPEHHGATAPSREYDVVVVGARCAGAPTAMLLALAGHDVLVVDRAELPSDTLSTHGLSRGAIVSLTRWGLLDEVLASGAPAIRTVSFQVAGERPTVRTVKHTAGVDQLLAPRRHILDAILLDAARGAGASVETGVTVTGVLTNDAGVRGIRVRDREGRVGDIHARLVVGADGVRSRIARSVGARTVDERPADGALHYLYAAGLDRGRFEFHVGHRGFAGVFPTNAGEANVWICVPADRALHAAGARTDDFVGLLSTIAPSLARRLVRATATAPVRSAVRFPNHVLEGAGAGWALVGDAGYHRDPLTGHGITDAFRDAELLSVHAHRALRGDADMDTALAAYDAARREALAPIFDVTCALAAYPPAAEFVALQRELSTLVEAEAKWFAALPPVPTGNRIAAA